MLAGSVRDKEGLSVLARGPEAGQLIDFIAWADIEANGPYRWSYPEGEDHVQHGSCGFNQPPPVS